MTSSDEPSRTSNKPDMSSQSLVVSRGITRAQTGLTVYQTGSDTSSDRSDGISNGYDTSSDRSDSASKGNGTSLAGLTVYYTGVTRAQTGPTVYISKELVS